MTRTIIAGLAKGALLGVFLISQQKLINKSLSSTTYLFPLAVGVITLIDIFVFNSHITLLSIISISLLFSSGVLFVLIGHISYMNTQHKLIFMLMICCVVGFSIMDRIGIPQSGWYTYLLFTGFGNMLVLLIYQRKKLSIVPVRRWAGISLLWVFPELFFNYAISSYLAVSYGYLAITFRIPILMLISVFMYKEGRLPDQMLFAFVALISVLLLFIETI